ncbi:hypothetical protein CRYUN_Cryun07bG0161400 [Craigia yunnanensis]
MKEKILIGEIIRGGACGYVNLFSNGYDTNTAALSTTLFNNGFACGTCYQMKCVQSPWCYPRVQFTTVIATNLCPPNWSQDSSNGGWCNTPRVHFDMSKPAFMKIAQWKAGIVPVLNRRVPCVRPGELRFSFQGNGYWLLVYVMNVGGGGDIAKMWVKGSKTGRISMSHDWGASYQAFATHMLECCTCKLECRIDLQDKCELPLINKFTIALFFSFLKPY